MASQQPYHTPEEYLERERAAQTKSEYLDGRIYAMSGATLSHVRITANLYASLGVQLRGRPCEAFTSDMKVRVSATGLYTYPDASVACGQPLFGEDQSGILLNPTAIFEVLSPSTASYDRGEKFAHYQRLHSLREYVLIAQSRMRVERFARDPAEVDAWVLTAAEEPDATVKLTSIGCTLRVGELYERVELPAHPPLRAVYEDAPAYAAIPSA